MNLKSVSDIQHSFGCVVAEKVFKDFLNFLFTHKNKHFQHSNVASRAEAKLFRTGWSLHDVTVRMVYMHSS